MSNRTHHAVRNMAIFILERACVHLVERDYNNGRVPDGAVNDAISIMLHSARGRVEIALSTPSSHHAAQRPRSR